MNQVDYSSLKSYYETFKYELSEENEVTLIKSSVSKEDSKKFLELKRLLSFDDDDDVSF
jgi:hypothetical protein